MAAKTWWGPQTRKQSPTGMFSGFGRSQSGRGGGWSLPGTSSWWENQRPMTTGAGGQVNRGDLPPGAQQVVGPTPTPSGPDPNRTRNVPIGDPSLLPDIPPGYPLGPGATYISQPPPSSSSWNPWGPGGSQEEWQAERDVAFQSQSGWLPDDLFSIFEQAYGLVPMGRSGFDYSGTGAIRGLPGIFSAGPSREQSTKFRATLDSPGGRLIQSAFDIAGANNVRVDALLDGTNPNLWVTSNLQTLTDLGYSIEDAEALLMDELEQRGQDFGPAPDVTTTIEDTLRALFGIGQESGLMAPGAGASSALYS